MGFGNELRGLELQSASNEYKGVSEGFPNQIPQPPEIFRIIPTYSRKTRSAHKPHKEFSYFYPKVKSNEKSNLVFTNLTSLTKSDEIKDIKFYHLIDLL